MSEVCHRGSNVPPGLRAESYDVGGLRFVRFDLPARVEAPEGFTPAERATLEHLSAGKSSAEIARARGTSVRTVANQLASMYRKVGVCSRQELLAALICR